MKWIRILTSSGAPHGSTGNASKDRPIITRARSRGTVWGRLAPGQKKVFTLLFTNPTPQRGIGYQNGSPTHQEWLRQGRARLPPSRLRRAVACEQCFQKVLPCAPNHKPTSPSPPHRAAPQSLNQRIASRATLLQSAIRNRVPAPTPPIMPKAFHNSPRETETPHTPRPSPAPLSTERNRGRNNPGLIPPAPCSSLDKARPERPCFNPQSPIRNPQSWPTHLSTNGGRNLTKNSARTL